MNKREYLGQVWPADVWPADDIPFCSILTYFQYSLIHDLALNLESILVSKFHIFMYISLDKDKPRKYLFLKSMYYVCP